jgi:hypothetical protein
LTLDITCNDGIPGYGMSVLETGADGEESRVIPVNPGDRVSATLSYDATTGTIKLRGRNVTQRATYVVSGHTDGASWNDVAYDYLPVPAVPSLTFTTIAFTGLTLNGFPATQAGTFEGEDYYSQSKLLVRTGAFGSGGKAFNFRWVASQ